MMQWKRMMACGLIGLMVLAGCGKKEETGAEATSASSSAESEVTSESAESTSASSASSASEAEETVPEMDEATAALMALPLVGDDFKLEDCIQLTDYKNLDLTVEAVEVTDEEVEAYMESLVEPVDVEDPEKVLEEGDTAVLDFVGKKDGEAFSGGSGTDYPLEIGSGQFIPGFEEGMIGMKVGEERDLELTFPEDYPSEDLAGQDTVFTVTLKAIQQMPALDDAWVKQYTEGEMETLDEFRASSRETLEADSREYAETMALSDAWTQILEKSTFLALPESYVKTGAEEFDAFVEEEAAMYGYEDRAEYLEQMGMSEAEYASYRDSSARNETQSRLVIEALTEAEQVSTDSEEYKAALEELAELYEMSVDEMKEQFDGDGLEEYVMTELLMKRVLSYNVTE